MTDSRQPLSKSKKKFGRRLTRITQIRSLFLLFICVICVNLRLNILDLCQPVHVRLQNLWDQNTAIFLLIVLKHSDPRAADG